MIWNIDRKKYVKFTFSFVWQFQSLMNTPNVNQLSWFLNQRKLLCNTKTKWHWPKGNFTNFLHFVIQNSAKFNSRFTETTISTSQTKTVHCLLYATIFIKNYKLWQLQQNTKSVYLCKLFLVIKYLLFNLSLLIFSPLLTWRSNANLFGIFNCWHLFIHSSFVSSYVAYWFNV